MLLRVPSPHPNGKSYQAAARLPSTLKGFERGTTVVLLIDFLVTMGVATAGLLYIKVNPLYLLMMSVLTFVLFLIVWALLLGSNKYLAKERKEN